MDFAQLSSSYALEPCKVISNCVTSNIPTINIKQWVWMKIVKRRNDGSTISWDFENWNIATGILER